MVKNQAEYGETTQDPKEMGEGKVERNHRLRKLDIIEQQSQAEFDKMTQDTEALQQVDAEANFRTHTSKQVHVPKYLRVSQEVLLCTHRSPLVPLVPHLCINRFPICATGPHSCTRKSPCVLPCLQHVPILKLFSVVLIFSYFHEFL